jgi:HSP20 family protein
MHVKKGGLEMDAAGNIFPGMGTADGAVPDFRPLYGGTMFIVPMSRESRQLARLFDDTFDRFFSAPNGGDGVGARSPALDVAETERSYTVKLDLPGVAKEDVKVSIEGRQITVQAQTRRDDERKDGERVVYRERSVQSCARSFTLPQEVDQAEAGAKLDNGVLTLTLPKRSARSTAQITVN